MLGKITLLGEPKSTQHIYKIACRPYPSIYMSSEGRAIKEDYAWQCKSQWHRPLLDEPFRIEVVLFHKTRRKQDIDNFNKLYFDAMTRTVWEDDNLIHEMNIRKEYDPKNPRIEVTLYDLQQSSVPD